MGYEVAIITNNNIKDDEIYYYIILLFVELVCGVPEFRHSTQDCSARKVV